jgi:hypothetical protein
VQLTLPRSQDDNRNKPQFQHWLAVKSQNQFSICRMSPSRYQSEPASQIWPHYPSTFRHTVRIQTYYDAGKGGRELARVKETLSRIIAYANCELVLCTRTITACHARGWMEACMFSIFMPSSAEFGHDFEVQLDVDLQHLHARAEP